MNNTSSCFLEGLISVRACIDSQNRTIENIYVDREKVVKRDRKITPFVSYLKRNSIPHELLDRDKIDDIAINNGGGKTHGGVIAFVSQRKYKDFDSYIKELSDSKSYAVFLDGIEDPYNFGYCIRNMYAFDCFGFVIPSRNWMSSANVVARASAGTSELARVTVAPDDETVLKSLKMHDIDIVCAALSKDSIPLFSFKPAKPFILFIGGEKRGISKEFIENAKTIVHIPYKNADAKFSLPAASAAAIFASHLANIM